MNDQWWSWILTVVGLTGFILAGRKVWWCWYINIGCQFLWFTYAIVTEQLGFVVASIFYFIVFTKNAIRWTKDYRETGFVEESLEPAKAQALKDYAKKDMEATLAAHRGHSAAIVGLTPSDEFVPPEMNFDPPNPNFCGQTQSHPPHEWSKMDEHSSFMWTRQCSGHS